MEIQTSGEKEPINPASLLKRFHGWKLEDAKARFSQLVKMAQENEPQRVTVHGKDAVVVISAREFAKLLPFTQQPDLHSLLSQSPFAKLGELNAGSTYSPVRDVDL